MAVKWKQLLFLAPLVVCWSASKQNYPEINEAKGGEFQNITNCYNKTVGPSSFIHILRQCFHLRDHCLHACPLLTLVGQRRAEE